MNKKVKKNSMTNWGLTVFGCCGLLCITILIFPLFHPKYKDFKIMYALTKHDSQFDFNDWRFEAIEKQVEFSNNLSRLMLKMLKQINKRKNCRK